MVLPHLMSLGHQIVLSKASPLFSMLIAFNELVWPIHHLPRYLLIQYTEFPFLVHQGSGFPRGPLGGDNVQVQRKVRGNLVI